MKISIPILFLVVISLVTGCAIKGNFDPINVRADRSPFPQVHSIPSDQTETTAKQVFNKTGDVKSLLQVYRQYSQYYYNEAVEQLDRKNDYVANQYAAIVAYYQFLLGGLFVHESDVETACKAYKAASTLGRLTSRKAEYEQAFKKLSCPY